MTNGYNFYFKDADRVMVFPITPGKLDIKVGTKNKVVSLINEGDINILKSPTLAEFSFEAIFPMRKYPYSREVESWQTYYDFFRGLMNSKKSFRFIVARTTPFGKRTWDTNELVSLESFDIDENADYGDDVHVNFKLKKYREYGVKTVKLKEVDPDTTSTATNPRPDENRTKEPKTYTIRGGDTLWSISKKFYGNGAKYQAIYNANKEVIEIEAKKRGFKSSSNGDRIWAGTVLVIPDGEYASSPSNNVSPAKKRQETYVPYVPSPLYKPESWKPSNYTPYVPSAVYKPKTPTRGINLGGKSKKENPFESFKSIFGGFFGNQARG